MAEKFVSQDFYGFLIEAEVEENGIVTAQVVVPESVSSLEGKFIILTVGNRQVAAARVCDNKAFFPDIVLEEHERLSPDQLKILVTAPLFSPISPRPF